MITYNMDLNLDKRHSDEAIAIRQGDHNGTTIVATLYQGGSQLTTTGLTAYFVMRLPDKKSYYRKACTYSAGVATVIIDEQYAASVAGVTDVAYFELQQGSSVIASSSSITVIVLPSATDGMSAGQRYDDEIVATIRQWLGEHPEATTTVQDDSLTAAKLKANSVTTEKIADGAVTEAKLAAGAVATGKIADSAVTSGKIADSSVTTSKLADGSVTYDKLAGVRKLTTTDIDAMF